MLRSQPTKPHLSASDLKQLTEQRQHDLDIIAVINSIFNAHSFSARAEAYCYFEVDQRPSFPLFGVTSEKHIEKIYAELLHTEPPTREEELRRQHQLHVLSERISAFRHEVNVCRDIVTTGAQRIPEASALREELVSARKNLAETDRAIATGVIATAPAKTNQPPLPDSQPVLLSKAEPEYSGEARRAKFNGDVRASITIDEHGYTTNISVLNSPGLGLDDNIIAALQKWRFKPAIKNGVPVVTAGVVVTLSFRLQ